MNIPDDPRKRHRSNDHHTSVQGAYDVGFRAGTQKAKLLIAYFDYPSLTADEAMRHAGVSARSCYWKRCSELREMGYIEQVIVGGVAWERRGESGSMQIVCAITNEGRLAAKQILSAS